MLRYTDMQYGEVDKVQTAINRLKCQHWNDAPTAVRRWTEVRKTAKTSKAIKTVIAELKKTCLSIAVCNKCPYWDDDLKCRIGYPVNWYIDDWEEYKDENA